MYGQNGIVGFTYNNINYYYRKNLLGDIVAIYNESGTKLCEYAYDAWGNCTILFDTNGIGALNPFRYRGYYWDSELNLYYLNARYYDPAICRFISQDNISYLDPEALNGLNLFAYCLNNPVMNVDPNGNDWWEFWKWDWEAIGIATAAVVAVGLFVVATALTAGAIGGIAGAALMCVATGTGFGAAIGGISAAINGTDIAAGILGGAVKGAATGLALGLGIMTGGGAFTVAGGFAALGGAIATNFAAGMLKYAIDNGMNGRKMNLHDALANGGMQALTGLFAFCAGALIGVSSAYNVPGINKMFSKAWWGNFGVSQIIEGVFYYPFNLVFSYLQKTYFYGDN